MDSEFNGLDDEVEERSPETSPNRRDSREQSIDSSGEETERRDSVVGVNPRMRVPKWNEFASATADIPPPPTIIEPSRRRRIRLSDGLESRFEMAARGQFVPLAERETVTSNLPLVASTLAMAPKLDETLAKGSVYRIPVSENLLFAMNECVSNAMSTLFVAKDCISRGDSSSASGYLKYAGRFMAILQQDLVSLRRERALRALGGDPVAICPSYRRAPLPSEEFISS